MALSSWDTLAFDTEGKPCEGNLVVENASVEIYKNWIYVRDEKMWQKGRSYYDKPIIAQINSGVLNLSKFQIIAERYADQNSIFVFCSDNNYENPKIMAGIGCYGFLNTASIYAEKLGLDPNLDWMGGSNYEDGKSTEIISRFTDKGVEEHIVPDEFVIKYEDAWCGVKQSTYEAFLKFLDRIVENQEAKKEWVDKVKASKPIRFNQGDAFFANALDSNIPATEIGKCEQPILAKLLNG